METGKAEAEKNLKTEKAEEPAKEPDTARVIYHRAKRVRKIFYFFMALFEKEVIKSYQKYIPV